MSSTFLQYIKRFLHDPIDKPFDIPKHKERAKEYADILRISALEEADTSDQIASCMERSLLPQGIMQEFNEIRHPLSDEKLEVSPLHIQEIKAIVENVLKNLADKINNLPDKDKFFYIWRNLQDALYETLNDKPYGKFLSVIPADTRVPDHSIWEHLKTVSAINAYSGYQNNSLFLCSIGPVQSFISQARKAQDLFSGSYLLSYLTFVAITKIVEEYGPTAIIYPNLFAQPLIDWYLEKDIKIDVKNSLSSQIDIPTIPNRFVAIIPESGSKEINELAQGVIKKVKDKWNEITQQVLSSFGINEKEMARHLDDFPQIYWVAIPWRKDEEDIGIDDLSIFVKPEIEKFKKLLNFASQKGEFKPNVGLLYQLLYSSLEKSMGSRKNLRDFFQTVEEGRKCSICGEKEALIEAGSGNLKIGKFIAKGEKLCGLCFTKRGFEKYFNSKFNKTLSFPSTAEVALADFKEKALNNAKEELREFINEFKAVAGDKFPEANPLPKLENDFQGIDNLEGEWFFEENLRERFCEKYLEISLNEEIIENLKENLKTLCEIVGKPNPYFAILNLDGDSLGKWLSGELLPSIECAYNSKVWSSLPDDFKKELKEISSGKILTPAIHSAISIALRNYSLEFVRQIVEQEYLGKLVYSGGDDVLAFVNLRDLFSVMRKLREAFSGHIKFQDGKIEINSNNNTGFVEKEGRLLLTMGKKASVSMGVVIAHYKMPLRIVLLKLREMLKRAKNVYGKDAFCIALLKHSGEERIGVSKWRYDTVDVLQSLEDMCKLMNKENESYFSIGFIYHLMSEFFRLCNEDGTFTATGEVFNVELKRLLSRAYNGPESKKKEIIEKVLDPLQKLFWSTGGNLLNFIHLLEIVAFTVRGTRA